MSTLTSTVECETTRQVIDGFGEIFECICKDFFRQKTVHLNDARKKSAKTAELIKKMVWSVKNCNDPLTVENKRKAELLDRIENIGLHLDKLINSIEKKVTRTVMFSIWAVDEINELITGTRKCLNELSGYIYSGDGETGRILLAECESYLKKCHEYSRNHTERFSQGICLLESKAIYQPMLDSFHEIIKNIKSSMETLH